MHRIGSSARDDASDPTSAHGARSQMGAPDRNTGMVVALAMFLISIAIILGIKPVSG